MSVNEKMTAIADGVRTLSGESGKMGLDAMSEKIATANVTVDGQSDLIHQIKVALRGKAAGSGEGTKEEQEKSLTVTENGSYEILPDEGKVMSKATVNVAVPEPVLAPLTATENGIYSPEDGIDGYSAVVVEVPTGSDGADNLGLLITSQLERVESNVKGTFAPYAFYENDTIKYVSLPNIQYSKERVFYGCGNLETLLLPGLIGYTYQYLAYNCSNLTTVDVHNTSYVSSYSFYNCAKLERIELDKVGTIATNSFYGCVKLKTIIIRAETVPSLGGTSAFTSTPIEKNTGYIYVPSALIEEYKSATNWSTYAARFRAIEDYPDICGGTQV